MGNMLEQYDIVVFGFMANYIATAFFPAKDAITNLFLVFYIFVIGYASRPIGSLLFGYLSDGFGRKKALIFSVILMGVSTSLIGVLPTYAAVGSIATLLLLLCRLFQGLAVGGEYITSIAFLIEHASPDERGFMGSWAAFGVNFGNLIASVLSTLVIYGITQSILPPMGWRIIFLIAALGTFVGLWIRLKNSETLPFIRENSIESKNFFNTHWSNVFKTIRDKKNECFLIVILTSLGTCVTYLIYLYAPLHATLFHNMSRWKILGVNSLSVLLLVGLVPFFGYLSDRHGRKKLLLIAATIFLLLAYPFFWTASYGSLISFLIMQSLLSIGVAIFHSIAPVVIVEIMPIKIRCTISGFLYGIAASLFGASSPIISLWLVEYTNSYISPCYYLIIFSAISILAIAILLREPLSQGHFKSELQSQFSS